jgi:hypothetical protein
MTRTMRRRHDARGVLRGLTHGSLVVAYRDRDAAGTAHHSAPCGELCVHHTMQVSYGPHTIEAAVHRQGCAGGERPAWCTCRLSRSAFGISATLEVLAAQEELEAHFDRALNAQTVVDLKKPPA